ncbi:hypothetical protein O6H91_13G075600 [Diphasiastrum complanatum]|uniref:Uncharacterized protein n=10 Tax=Diphasiastrum complanatum TaxID=34168 RepID=A0ACC2BW51_DIPCM|nr:hypothetical protein O6H91_13G075600 [Diphasiastrum complanatum]KAJ7534010.1 hypothetical protein O6H91_13G075600 [Diphasiastrum complanatum]KAJ7534011.1 hypothetical protein O6H91_13G075600 [Diphasiastrum complanatum]KAJ7534012.1 hypothetical protein O6H91_13G075600 [Diphasiastrum complanatum]KAJ7534013.1 hypothetical protein O6H91_13G075600 [Diphasiastrum complanatum]
MSTLHEQRQRSSERGIAMSAGFGPVVAMYTVVSVGGFAWRINTAVQKALPEGYVGSKSLDTDEASRIVQSVFESSFTLGLLANLVCNFFVLVALVIKAIFFGRLTLFETQKVVERMINYVLFKGMFLTWVVQPEMMQVALWLVWFAVLGFLKMFQGLARDRLERLNASPTATLFTHGRVFSVLMLVLLSDIFWMQICVMVSKDTGMSTFLLLLYEPLTIAFDTLQALVVHGLQLLDVWQRHTSDAVSGDTELQPSERSAAGVAWEWRGALTRNFSFLMDLLSLLLALGHCFHIWWLRGLAFQVVDAVLFLNLRALLSAILKRIKGFMRVRKALNILQGALPDATHDELRTYDDDCAICKEPMARAKRLPCAHLFHLPCLLSWLDQGLAETYSCPTCRRPLFMGSSRMTSASSPISGQFVDSTGIGSLDADLSRLPHGQQNPLVNSSYQQTDIPFTSPGPLTQDRWNAAVTSSWRGSGADSDWTTRMHPVARDAAGVGTSIQGHSRGLNRLQLMMRRLSGTTHEHEQRSSDENGWSWWPFSRSTGTNNSGQADQPGRRRFDNSSLRRRNVNTSRLGLGRTENGNLRMTGMVSMVREVLPHIPDEVVIEDLRRTNSVTATVNNLL